MKIKVIGKAHREGKSRKSGNDYNFNQVHFTGPDCGVEGMAALTLNLDNAFLSLLDLFCLIIVDPPSTCLVEMRVHESDSKKGIADRPK